MKKTIIGILFLLWLVIIFLFSNQNGVNSEYLSNQVIDKVISVSFRITNQQISSEKRARIIQKYHPLIRKIAHFIIYFILGILVYLAVYLYKKNKKWTIWISVVFCIIYACSDELHQILSVGRTFKVKDILIDTLGSILGILLIKNIKSRRCKHEKIN